MAPRVQIMVAYVVDDDSVPLARIERVTIGGGIRVVEGEPQQHPTFERFHVHMLSPDRMIPDQLLDAETYDEAVDLAVAYGGKRIQHAAKVAELAESLRVSGIDPAAARDAVLKA